MIITPLLQLNFISLCADTAGSTQRRKLRERTERSNMYLYALMCFLLPLHVSASPMTAELYKEGYRVKSDHVISSITVASRIQCLHRCKRINDCQGMNVKISPKNPMKCELTSAVISQENEGKFMVKDPTWEFYQVLKTVRYSIKVVSNGGTNSGDLKVSYITVNDQLTTRSTRGTRGMIVIAFDYEKGPSPALVDHVDGFAEAARFLDGITNGKITIVVVHDTAVDSKGSTLEKHVKDAFAMIGATKINNIGYRIPYCLIAMKGHSVAWKKEVLGTAAGESVVCEAKIY